MRIREIIVVEGRDDTAAVRRSVDAVTIETHGYGISAHTWELIDKAHAENGIIVFTDPDSAGERIRKRILDRYPDAKQAFLDPDDARRSGDIGIENANPKAIRQALKRARCSELCCGAVFSMEDMIKSGLTGRQDSAQRRRRIGQKLGIGHANTKTFLSRLNSFGITRDELESALKEIT